MSITEIAVTSTSLFMLLAALGTMYSARGYSFDLRRKRKNPGLDRNRNPGRREEDRIATA